jgi:putative glycosyltransferase (TIGR04372 family)
MKKQVYFIHPLINRIGELVCQFYMLKQLYNTDQYQLNVITNNPEQIGGVNKAVFDIVTRGVKLIYTEDPSILWKAYGSSRNEIIENDDGIIAYITTAELMTIYLNHVIDNPTRQFFKLNQVEEYKGMLLAQAYGVPDGAEIVTIHIRDGAYFDHNKAHSYRNANPDNYLQTIDYLIAKGYYVVRLGSNKSEPIRQFGRQFIDTAFHPACCDLVDPYFMSKSKFHIGTFSGGSDLAFIFNIPILYTNHLVIAACHSLVTSLLLFKKYYSRQLQRFLSYDEILFSPALEFCRNRHFDLAGIELLENSPDEILAATIEMLARLDGSYETTAEVQSRYEQLRRLQYKADVCRRNEISKAATFVPMYNLYNAPSIISHEYLKMNPEFVGHVWPEQVRFDWEPEFSF